MGHAGGAQLALTPCFECLPAGAVGGAARTAMGTLLMLAFTVLKAELNNNRLTSIWLWSIVINRETLGLALPWTLPAD